MNTAVTDVITSYKPRTIKTLRDQQSALTPCIDPYIIENQVFEYIYNTQRTLVNPNKEACFRCHYMYLKSMMPRKYIQYAVSKESIYYLVANEVIDPFLFFVNGYMVPWSMISIIMTHEDYHILCRTDDPTWIDRFKHVESLNVIHLPDGCVYADYPLGDIGNRVFGFDVMGNFTEDPNCPISIVDESVFMHYNAFSTTGGVNAHKVTSDTTIKYFPNNVIIFRNGILDTTSTVNFESTLVTINDGTNPNADNIYFIVFRDERARDTVDNIKHANLDMIKPYVEQQNAGETVPEWVTDLEKEFDFEMSRQKTYATNVEESIEYIMNYNASLFEEAYLANRNLVVEEKDGQWVLDNLRDDGTIYIPRKHGLFTDEYILMLVNGMLYKFYYAARYTPDYCIIPIKGINAEDTVELLRFNGVNNNSFDIVVNANDSFRNYDENYVNDQMILFSTIPPTDDYQFPADGLQHFPVEYTLEKDENGWMRITLADEKYYGQKLKLVYKHQFRHYWFNIIQASATDSYCIDLGTKFMYCHDYSKYMVFFNGRRLSTDQYRLCLPVRSTTPFYKFELYLTMLVQEGDRVDIIYTPSLLKDVVLVPQLGEDGKITVDKSSITYSLSKNLYMVWANGKKISSSKIANIDSTHIKIIEDIETLKYVCITKFLPDIDELTEVFQASTALWDHIIAQLTDEEVEQLLSFAGVTITDTEQDIYANSVSVRSVMLELIREKFIMQANVDTTGPFAYGYTDVDTTAIESYDSGNNALLMAGDANRTDNIDGVNREWP